MCLRKSRIAERPRRGARRAAGRARPSRRTTSPSSGDGGTGRPSKRLDEVARTATAGRGSRARRRRRRSRSRASSPRRRRPPRCRRCRAPGSSARPPSARRSRPSRPRRRSAARRCGRAGRSPRRPRRRRCGPSRGSVSSRSSRPMRNLTVTGTPYGDAAADRRRGRSPAAAFGLAGTAAPPPLRVTLAAGQPKLRSMWSTRSASHSLRTASPSIAGSLP